jgi:hypothetical protein
MLEVRERGAVTREQLDFTGARLEHTPAQAPAPRAPAPVSDQNIAAAERIRRQVAAAVGRCQLPPEAIVDGRCGRCWGRRAA